MKRKLIAIAVVVALGAAAVVYLPTLVGYLKIGTTFAAQQMCACVHVSGRTLESCLGDLGKAGGLLTVSVDGDAVRATALLGLFSGEARNEPPYGCHPAR